MASETPKTDSRSEMTQSPRRHGTGNANPPTQENPQALTGEPGPYLRKKAARDTTSPGRERRTRHLPAPPRRLACPREQSRRRRGRREPQETPRACARTPPDVSGPDAPTQKGDRATTKQLSPQNARPAVPAEGGNVRGARAGDATVMETRDPRHAGAGQTRCRPGTGVRYRRAAHVVPADEDTARLLLGDPAHAAADQSGTRSFRTRHLGTVQIWAISGFSPEPSNRTPRSWDPDAGLF